MSMQEIGNSPGGYTCHRNVESSDIAEKSDFMKLLK